MSVEKRIDYVEQDGYKNYIKDSDSVTVPREFKSRKDATPTKLAYITADEAKMLKKMKPDTPHKGPSGVPSYDDYDADGDFTSGAAMSAAESGKNTSDTLAAGMSGKDVDEIRSSVIAAGAGQRVNPGFFDSRDRVSPFELAAAKKFNPRAFAATRGGLGSFFTGGGFLGNLVRGIGQRFGLGKTFDQPTYDMRGLDSINPVYYDDLDNELMLSTTTTPKTVAPNLITETFKGVMPMKKPMVGTEQTILSQYDNYLKDAPDSNPLSLEDFAKLQAGASGGILSL
jgi:hypothetical protein